MSPGETEPAISASLFFHVHVVEVEWGDCDAAGIVFYPRYFAYFDASTGRLFDAALGMRKREWTARYGIVGIPMVDTRASFRAPSRYGNLLRIETTVTRLGRSSIEIAHRVTNAETLALEGSEKRVWTGRGADETSLTAVPIPDEVRTRLSGA